MAVNILEAGDLELVGPKPNHLVVVRDPDFVEDPENPDQIASKAVELGSIGTKLIDWDMEGPFQAPALTLFDYMGASTVGEIVDPNTWEITAVGALNLGSLSNNVPVDGKNSYVVRFFDDSDAAGGVMILFATSALTDGPTLRYTPGTGLVFNRDFTTGAEVVDAGYTAGGFIVVYQNNATGEYTIVTENVVHNYSNPVGAPAPGRTHTMLLLQGITAELSVAKGRTHLSSFIDTVPFALPPGFEDYNPIGSMGPATLPDNAGQGDYLRVANVNNYYQQTEYFVGDLLQLVDTASGQVKPVFEIINSEITIKVPTDLPTLVAVIEKYSDKVFGPKGFVVVRIEDGYSIPTMGLAYIVGRDLSWLYIITDNKETVIESPGYLLYLVNCKLGGLQGKYKSSHSFVRAINFSNTHINQSAMHSSTQLISPNSLGYAEIIDTTTRSYIEYNHFTELSTQKFVFNNSPVWLTNVGGTIYTSNDVKAAGIVNYHSFQRGGTIPSLGLNNLMSGYYASTIIDTNVNVIVDGLISVQNQTLSGNVKLGLVRNEDGTTNFPGFGTPTGIYGLNSSITDNDPDRFRLGQFELNMEIDPPAGQPLLYSIRSSNIVNLTFYYGFNGAGYTPSHLVGHKAGATTRITYSSSYSKAGGVEWAGKFTNSFGSLTTTTVNTVGADGTFVSVPQIL